MTENTMDKSATFDCGTSETQFTNGDKLEKGCFNFGHSIQELSKDDGLKQTQININSQVIGQSTSIEYPTLRAFIKKMGVLAFILDIMIILLFIVFVVLGETGVIPAHKRGFTCGDASISFPFTGDTISAGVVLGSVVVPLFIMWFVEVLRAQSHSSRLAVWKRSLCISLYWFNKFLIGFGVHFALVDAMKSFMGESRPHFLDSCRPQEAINCTVGTFISNFTCTNTEYPVQLVFDSYRSFPSGHSSVGNFVGLFVAWYLYRRFPSTGSKWLVPLFQTLSLIWGVACGITRITDNRHNWWDVLIGGIIGLSFAAYTAKCLCHNFKVFRTSWSDEHLETSSLPLRSENQLLSVTTNGKDDVNSQCA
uniref:Putative lipid phosphate phosphatase n=2 Tax=Nyssomyia neivai TaxID=330878 RepID=A0A1L8DYD3_9DIPT